VESEGIDRETLALPGYQDDLVRAVARANPNTVVVVNSGAPVLMPWEPDVPVIILTWFPGQEFGNALADVLLGRAEPGGRMPTTWWRRSDGLPRVQPDDGVLDYTADSGIGYRRDASDSEILFPFGHGMGYTDWEYEEMAVRAESGDDPVVTVSLRNRGERRGSEVVQVYAVRPETEILRPEWALAGFAKVEADPGEGVTAIVRPSRRTFEHWDPDTGWTTCHGQWSLAAGRSVRDLRLEDVLQI
jgi:beta-glucosidase